MFECDGSFDVKLIDLSLSIEKFNYRDGQEDKMFEMYSKMMPIFRPPELLSKKKKYSEKADIWSAGCIIFNMVTGIPPFYESDLSAL